MPIISEWQQKLPHVHKDTEQIQFNGVPKEVVWPPNHPVSAFFVGKLPHADRLRRQHPRLPRPQRPLLQPQH